MQTNLEGKIRNTNVPLYRPLLPLFEAITNSIQAIEDAGNGQGKIDISINRSKQTTLSDSDAAYSDIVGFTVTDTGVGFTDENFNAFNESDTRYKEKRGGRGVGRFSWLVAFHEVIIESTYAKNGSHLRRTFRFVPRGDGIEDAAVENSRTAVNTTTVTLDGYKKQYQKMCPRRSETIAAFIVEHFLEYFVGPDCPEMYLHDPATR